MNKKLRPLTEEETQALTPIFNAFAAEIQPVLDTHKDAVLSSGFYFDEETNTPQSCFIIFDQEKVKDVNGIPSTIGKEKIPVKVIYAPRR